MLNNSVSIWIKWQQNSTGIFIFIFIFNDTGAESVKFQDAFLLPNGVHMEIIELQSDTELQASERTFGGF